MKQVATSTYKVDFSPKPNARPTKTPTGRAPRVVRLLALAHRVDVMVRIGEFKDLADAARRLGITRARVTQITNLLLLAPEIQEAILELPQVTKGRDPVSERILRAIVAEPDWTRQMKMWRQIHGLPTVPSDEGRREVPVQDRPGTDPGH